MDLFSDTYLSTRLLMYQLTHNFDLFTDLYLIIKLTNKAETFFGGTNISDTSSYTFGKLTNPLVTTVLPVILYRVQSGV